MDHEVDNPARRDLVEVVRAHAQIVDVMREELAGSGQEEGEPSREQQPSGNRQQHRPAVTQHHREISAPVVVPVAHRPRIS
jgi:hypothetical protein